MDEKPPHVNAKPAIDAKLVEFLVEGHERKVSRTLDKGERVTFKGVDNVSETMVVTEPICAECTERYSDGVWRVVSWSLGTIRPAPPPPSWWARLIAWIRRKPLPKARLLSPTKTVQAD